MLTSFVWSLVSVETILSSGFYFPERWRKVPSFVNIKLPLPPSTHKMSFEGDDDFVDGKQWVCRLHISSFPPTDLAQKQWLHISSDLAQPLEFGFEVFGLQ